MVSYFRGWKPYMELVRSVGTNPPKVGVPPTHHRGKKIGRRHQKIAENRVFTVLVKIVTHFCLWQRTKLFNPTNPRDGHPGGARGFAAPPNFRLISDLHPHQNTCTPTKTFKKMFIWSWFWPNFFNLQTFSNFMISMVHFCKILPSFCMKFT